MQTLKLASLLLLLGATLAQPALAQTKAAPADPKKAAAGLNELECRTLLRLGGDERAYTLLYFHGFVSGRQNQMALSTDAMAEATDKIVDHCIDKPGDKLLSVFESVRKAR